MSKAGMVILLVLGMMLLRLEGSRANQASADSLWHYLQTQKRDTLYVEKMNALTDQLIISGEQDPLPLAKEAYRIADSLNYPRGMAICVLNMAIAYDIQAKYREALQHYVDALRLIREEGNMDFYEAQAYINLGYFFSSQHEFEKAIEYTRKAAKIETQMYGESGAAYSWGNLGNYFIHLGQYDSARIYTLKSFEGYKSLDDSSGIGDIYHNLALIAFHGEKDAEKALNYALQAQALYESSVFSEAEAITECLATIGMLYTELGRYNLASYYLSKAVNTAREKKLINILKTALDRQTRLFSKQERWEEAFRLQQESYALHDSLDHQRTMFSLEQMQAQFELETKEAHIALLNKDKVIQQDELERQTLLRNGFIGLFGLLLMVALMLYRNNEEKRRNNRLLSNQKQELEEKSDAILRQNKQLQDQRKAMLGQSEKLHRAHQQILRQKETIERKNQDITDSLNYARRIQYAMLPKANELSTIMAESFVWLKPRDIVSGDFSWNAAHNNKIFIASVDCTGHGVPGAFVSLIAGMFLNQIVLQEGESSPASILHKLNQYIHRVLSYEGRDNNDGLEIGLCVIDKADQSLEFAGARGNLYWVEAGNINKIKGDRLMLGATELEPSAIRSHYFPYKAGMAFYMCSDGLRDQFGGPQDKKFGEHRLCRLLKSIAAEPAAQQRERIVETLGHWMDGHDQVDDILIVGWRVG